MKTTQVPIGTAATAVAAASLVSSGGPVRSVEILNPSGSGGSIFVGGDATVTASGASKGREIAAGASAWTVDLALGEAVYAVTASGTVTVTVTVAGAS